MPIVPAAATARNSASPAAEVPAAGGGNGQVCVKTRSKDYHCPSDRFYGKTKQGSPISEAAARAAGDRPDHGKACS